MNNDEIELDADTIQSLQEIFKDSQGTVMVRATATPPLGDEPALSQPAPSTGNEPELSGARPMCDVCGKPFRYRVVVGGKFRSWIGCACQLNPYEDIVFQELAKRYQELILHGRTRGLRLTQPYPPYEDDQSSDE